MKEKDLVIVKSGDRLFEGLIEKIEWDIDQNIFLINGEWFCQSEVTSKKGIEIIQVATPKFEYDGKELYVEERMYSNLNQFQDDINEYEQKGATKCFFHTLKTTHEPTLGTIYWVRVKFIK
jgi:hypothetical protein